MKNVLKKTLVIGTGSALAIGCVYAAYRFTDFTKVAEVAGDVADTAGEAAGEVAETVAEVAALTASTVLEIS